MALSISARPGHPSVDRVVADVADAAAMIYVWDRRAVGILLLLLTPAPVLAPVAPFLCKIEA